MRLTIVADDKRVTVDGEGLVFDFPISPEIHAVQWNGASGEIEYNNGTGNTAILEITGFQYIVDAFFVEEARLAQAVIDAESARVAAITYADYRRSAYPPVTEQLAMQYDDLINGTTLWKDAVLAVKALYPKPI